MILFYFLTTTKMVQNWLNIYFCRKNFSSGGNYYDHSISCTGKYLSSHIAVILDQKYLLLQIIRVCQPVAITLFSCDFLSYCYLVITHFRYCFLLVSFREIGSLSTFTYFVPNLRTIFRHFIDTIYNCIIIGLLLFKVNNGVHSSG